MWNIQQLAELYKIKKNQIDLFNNHFKKNSTNKNISPKVFKVIESLFNYLFYNRPKEKCLYT